MNGAAFFLVVNFVVAISFAAVFMVVAGRSQSRKAAILLGIGFGIASLSAICELLIAYAGPPKLWALGAFATVLSGMVMISLAIAEMYNRRIELRLTAVFVAAALANAYLIYDLPRGTPLQAFLYQGPFAIVILAGAMIVIQARRQTAIDRFLALLLMATGLHFFAKAGLAVIFGSGAVATDYIRTSYALISQSLTAVLMVAVGLTLLAKLVLEIMHVHKTESEIDLLSGLLNRRGFHRRVDRLFGDDPKAVHSIILCDLDHFKRINDSFGHDVGDAVIEAFAEHLRVTTPPHCAVGRLGGEEFAIFLPHSDTVAAVHLAQRLQFGTMPLRALPPGIAVTASFGVAAVSSLHGLAAAYRQADQALYSAKTRGRNRVELASGDAPEASMQGAQRPVIRS
ncbi:diguanylate cyclase [Agrobacterium albertimagni AOL15]|uniref:diguanylate cyclase n=1 Tax=Agrobacterium albertimagni AOL15 TaxID=1156935 RepID=K2R1A3_9HYPH|nr:diguanylate cyclase [Agrobacterium albertimagni]EKF61627.1 diguanylate cyclase [Agrobacterium albertimagni AOL15]